MILPIVAYGNGILRKKCEEIDADYPELKKLLADMYDTMHHAEGVGLAAPQIGLPIRVFVIDLDCLSEDEPQFKGYQLTMINPEIIERSGDDVTMNEGCLSIPGINESVTRKNKIVVNYFDENFVEHEKTFEGFEARVIQHEYDHLEGHTFIDRINPIRRQMIRGKLNSIIKGKISCRYKIKTA